MRNIFTIITVIVLGTLFSYSISLFANPVEIPGTTILQEPSIVIPDAPSGDASSTIQFVGFKILGFLKMFVSGLALIYLVLVGTYMVIYSENEERIKSQRKQITYALIGFLFLNIPGLIYTIFLPNEQGGQSLGTSTPWSDTSSTAGSFVWNTAGFEGALGDLIAFFRLFIFGLAVVLFTWGLFRMIISAGNEEAQKVGRNRLIYGTIGLIFLGFAEGWSTLVAEGDFAGRLTQTAGKIFGIGIFFAAPIAVFFLIWGSYYYITAAGDEERIKKGKTIVVNTAIATLILIASLSFMNDLIKFNL